VGTLLIVLPLVAALVTVLYGVVDSLLRAWFDHRAKLALLEKVGKDPKLLDRVDGLGALLTDRPGQKIARQNYIVTGLVLAGIGVLAVVTGLTLRFGELAVGAYLGGIGCILIGILLAVVGLLVRGLSKDPTSALKNG